MVAVEVMRRDSQTLSCFIDIEQRIWHVGLLLRRRKTRERGCADLLQIAEQPGKFLL